MRSLILALGILVVSTAGAFAEKRVALVIGMSKYQNVPALTNPVRDAAAMGELFKKAGFDSVDTKLDLSVSQLRNEMRAFAAAASDADIAVVYYAGHGIEVNGTNYLIPADAKLASDYDIPDETIALDRVLDALEPVKRLRLVILDACRDNPFNKTMKRSVGTRSIGRGLARVEPTTSNTLIAFAAKAGAVAADGDGNNSPFATALMKHITVPGVDLRIAFGSVRDDVIKTTANRQEPFVYGSLGGTNVALVPPAPSVAPAPAPQSDANAAARRDYEMAERVGTREAWDFFIATYPDSFYSKLATAQRNKLAAEETRRLATEKAKAAQEEQTRLAIEGAKKAEQDKAAAEAVKAEQARVAAELAKKAADDKAKAEQKVAALTPPAEQAAPKADAPVAVADIPKQLQTELRRVGCNTGEVSNDWNANAQKSLALFNKNAGMKLDVKVASADSLDAVKGKQGRICPLICERGYQADGDKCSRIVCKAGFEVGDDNTCQKIEVKKPAPPVVKRDEPAAKPEAKPKAADSAPSGQILCNMGGCRPVKKGCRIEMQTGTGGRGQIEVCN